jgi:hypothetical protein
MNDGSVVETTPVQHGPAGLNGWLTLVGIGIVFGPIRLTLYILETYKQIFRDGAWEAMTTPGTEFYHPMWGPFFIFEFTLNGLFVVGGVVLLILFLRHSRIFPGLFVSLTVANFGFILVDAWLSSYIVPDEPMFDEEMTRELVRSLLACAVWIPYMFFSKRVRNTFVV